MKKLGFIIVMSVIIAALALAGCASSGSGSADLPPIPAGAERIMLENGAYAIFRFDLPPGTTWSNYNKLTAEYMVDAANLAKKQRNDGDVRLMGNYTEENFQEAFGKRWANLETMNGPYIIDNTSRSFEKMGAVADEWFTVEYNITGSAGHTQLNRVNIPAAAATGPFYFGIGIPGMFEGRRNGITQLVKNVTLHHATNPALNVVSKGSGFEEATFVSWWEVGSTRMSGPPAE